ncbi:DUF4160 domain-containing protein [Flavobacterium sp. ZT3R18]|uniref:DUF4160 domain-containing protein n=1 Tax=Flavobacterium sp. ZT3R18 TaxID=2594429 RepID=UPI001C8F2FDC|nr:DUF4160 domain-containing protein [Flavobacterium sp. ZT3R18]
MFKSKNYACNKFVLWLNNFNVLFGNKQHNLPHIHVKYNEFEAVFSIPDGELLEGKLPNNKTKLVKAWIEIRQEDLMADWSLAIKGEPVFKIEPLR